MSIGHRGETVLGSLDLEITKADDTFKLATVPNSSDSKTLRLFSLRSNSLGELVDTIRDSLTGSFAAEFSSTPVSVRLGYRTSDGEFVEVNHVADFVEYVARLGDFERILLRAVAVTEKSKAAAASA